MFDLYMQLLGNPKFWAFVVIYTVVQGTLMWLLRR
jgi:hypothetical protein